MEFLVQLWRGLIDVWRRLDTSARATVMASGALAMVAVMALSMWSAKPDYRMLWSNLSSSDVDAIVADLGSRGVTYKLSDGGTTVMVPANRVYELRTSLAEAGLGKTGKVVGFEIFDRPSLGATEFVQNIQAQRARAGALSRTIEAYDAVNRANVHISMPPEKLLATEQEEPTASIVLTLAHAGVLTQPQVKGILNIVAGSVPGLVPDRVAMTDTEGNILAKPSVAEGPLALSNRQREIIAETERDLKNKIDGVIGKVFAHRSVAVSVELDFDQITTNSTVYNDEDKATVSEQITNETTSTTEPAGVGAAGAAAGLPPAYQTGTGGASTTINETSKDDMITNYDPSVTVTQTVTAPGSYKRISATVLVEPLAVGEDGEQTFTDLVPADKTRYIELVQGAIPFDAARGDQVVLMAAPFSVPPAPVQIAAGWNPGMILQSTWSVTQQHLLPIALVFAALIYVRRALIRATSVAGRQMPEPQAEESISPEAATRRRVTEEVERLVQQKPDEVVALIKGWLAAGD